MPKIQNLQLANKLAGISTEMVQFDHEGIGHIESEELHAELLTLANFFPVEEKESKPEGKKIEITLEEYVDDLKVEEPKAKKTTKK